ncbi:sn-glycerol-3-phosphate ABC transporter ATP-binding protein UgpC [Acrocarpospora macrocephala]|uniref:Glycerol-3-phosphate ABC transporter ATP-binding protein n=1 Tax=Acrocarpospora macrocephala TaxID=150177 RepID=A0A5M3WL95_9ACTN|nr:ABC transporter ATP-binding protein [Acrocarpospora macrocephala]GES10047.1 glycerol-3-phosphate ABC transporter ATP-binding protein [Acrocarpospora macrocephala]
MPTVEITAIRKTFGEVLALDGIGLTVQDGENVAVLGPSGSGKSTLLRIIAGLETPDAGDVAFGGVSQRGIPAHRRDCAIVFQQFALYPHMTAMGNITTGLRYGLGLSKSAAEARAREVATVMRVEHLLARKPRQMSGGQRQRIALARALARRSGVVLLDEPLSGLDAQLHAALRVEIAAMLRQVGATALNVTHDQLDAMAMADRIAVINEGKIEQVGTPDDLYDHPDSLFVAGFVGSPPMNLLPVESEGESSFDAVQVKASESVTLGVRAEHLTLAEPAADAWPVSGLVVLVEPTGVDRVVRMRTDRGEAIAIRCPAGTATPAPGTRITASAPPGAVRVFSQRTGRHLGGLDDAGVAVCRR